MDCDTNPCIIDPGVIGPGATLFDHSDIGPGATLSCSSSLISSNIPFVNSISDDETCDAASIPTNVPEFLTFIESSTRSVLLSIAQSHNITVPSKSVLNVVRNLISEHISSGGCLGSSLPSCTILNLGFCDEEHDDNDVDFQLSRDLKINILSRIIHKLKLRPLRRILLQDSVYHDRNGSLSYLRQELKKYITRLKHGKRTEEQRSKELKLDKDHQE